MFFIFLVSVIFIIYYYLKRNNDYWKNRGVPGPKPTMLIGNIGSSLIFKKTMGQIINEIYRDYPDYPFVGMFKGLTPSILVRDPEFIKSITVKNFKSFYNNEIIVDKENDPIMGRNPFFLRDQEWKQVRSQLTPCFTSGKMKFMYPLLEEVSDKMVKYLEKYDKNQPLEAKDLCTNFTLDNVASCAFGIDAKSFEGDTKFKSLASQFISPGTFTAIKILISAILFPTMAKWIPIKLVDKKVEDKMMELVEETLKYRTENNVVRNDFLHMMHQLMLSNKDFTIVDAVGHSAAFLIDGFETSSGVMSYVLYELASHPDVQEKLRQEIETSLRNNNGKLTYELVTEMDYLNAVVLESLRRNPPIFMLGKICTEKFTYESSEDSQFKKMSITVEPGMTMVLPTAALSWDDKNFPNAAIYKPERFVGDNKNNHQYTFMPFGEGPRQCLGQRFGSLQIKVGVANIVKNFKITVNKKTKEPLEIDPMYFILKPKGGIWLDFKKIATQ